MSNSMVVRIWLVVLVVLQPGFLVRPAMPSSSCRSSCGNNVHIPYPFGIDPGCGSPAFFNLLACMKSEVTAGEEDLLILVNPPSQNRRVLWIDNTSETMLVDWSTSCPISTSQSPDAIFSDFPNIRPSSHNVFALLNCTFNSSNHQYNGRTCDQMYRLFVIFKRFKPPCLFAESKHLRSSIAAFGCTHYVPVYHPSKDYSGVTGDLSFLGLKVEYQVPPEETRNCAQCESSGGVCGFNQQTLVETCLCNSNINPTPIAAGCGASTTEKKSGGLGKGSLVVIIIVPIIIIIILGGVIVVKFRVKCPCLSGPDDQGNDCNIQLLCCNGCCSSSARL